MRLVLLLCVLFHSAVAASLYTIQAVAPAGSLRGVATAISNGGFLAGQAADSSGNSIAFAGAPGAGPGQLALAAIADDVNSSGTVAGTVWIDGAASAAVWQDGTLQQFGIADSYATGINDNGAVAGSGLNGSRNSAFVSSNGQTTFIDAGKWSAATDINNTGMIAGNFQAADNSFQAFSWTAESGIRSLGTLGGRNSYANAVNDAGLIVGASATSSGHLHAFIHDGDILDLGTLGGFCSVAYGINSFGTAVGYSYNASGDMRAFVWTGGLMFDLNALVDPGSDWTLEAAYGINDQGQIVGSGLYQGVSTAFLLDPLNSSARLSSGAAALDISSVPEPASFGTVGAVGAVTLVVCRIRRRQRSGGRG